ncbi:Hypothetical protein LRC_14790 [Ligilactobacillus ruminis ATCC 27782]|uniref:Uncharacterized protein n=1 Tax=Ligilactobacillus ruminis (strain ATCC 27782 / RF3) TaxID=1069534 RepID=G2SQZ0_LIGR2|nr:Hypothetical protein LRC_14790 [Ligilactobacillus ruminis ATCC 27782]
MEGDCHAYAKNRIRFAIDCKSDPVFRLRHRFSTEKAILSKKAVTSGY